MVVCVCVQILNMFMTGLEVDPGFLPHLIIPLNVWIFWLWIILFEIITTDHLNDFKCLSEQLIKGRNLLRH